MKRKDLYEYVRQEIINELSPAELKANQLTIQLNKQKLADANKQLAITKDPLEKAQIAATIAVNKEKLAASVVDASTKTSTNESDLEEARKGNNLKAGPNFAAIKSAYAGSIIERILNKIEEAGDAGVTPKEIMVAVGIKAPSQLNPIMRELMELGAISGPPSREEAEPEEITPEDDLVNIGIPKVTDNPEDKEVDDDELVAADDEYYKPEEEDSTEEEPKAIDIKAADKEAEKVVGGKSNAKKLSPEDEEKYTKLKAGIAAKVGKIKKLPAAKRVASDDFKILKQLIAREDVKKLFKDKGVSLKDVVSDVM
jgi:hypothetical protein